MLNFIVLIFVFFFGCEMVLVFVEEEYLGKGGEFGLCSNCELFCDK